MTLIVLAARRLALALTLAAAVHGAGTAAGAVTLQVKAGDPTPDAGGCGSKANPCDTIQAGVDAAAPGDVVNVAKGDYAEDVLIETNGIRLRGSGTLLGSSNTVCAGDATRTDFARCSDLETQVECDAAWHLAGTNQNGGPAVPQAASCFWTGTSCSGCGTRNEIEGDCTNSCTPILPAVLRVAADDVVVEKLRVRGGLFAGISVQAGAENASLRRVRVESSGSVCVGAEGNGIEVFSSSLRACRGRCLVVAAEQAVISKNRIVGCDSDGIFTVGADTVLERNTVIGSFDNCILLLGNGALVERNRVSHCNSRGIEAMGSAFSVLRNQVRVTSDGISAKCEDSPTTCLDGALTRLAGGPDSQACQFVADQPTCEASFELGFRGVASCFWTGTACTSCQLEDVTNGDCTNSCAAPGSDPCADALVSANRVSDAAPGQCVDADALDAGLVVEGTRGSFCTEGGLDLDGVGIVARGNTISDSGFDVLSHGIAARGAEHRIESNTVLRGAADGFNVEAGTDIILDGNRAIDNAQDGFDVETDSTGTQILAATATDNVDAGIEVSSGAQGTVVTNGKASGNLVDFCDEGTNTSESGGAFGTTSTACIPD